MSTDNSKCGIAILFGRIEYDGRVQRILNSLETNYDITLICLGISNSIGSNFGYNVIRLNHHYKYILHIKFLIKVFKEVKSLKPDFEKLKELGLRGVVVTAPGQEVDFVSRCFFPKLRVNEDPVTGSAHCELAPYWASRLGRNKLRARQLSKRSGSVECEVKDNRVFLSGNNVDYMTAEINIPQN